MAEELSTLDMDSSVIATLGKAQISTVQQLLDATATPQQSEHLAKRLGVSNEQVRTWADRANLLQIPEVGPQAARLLLACGINSPSDLQRWQTDDLYRKLQEVNGRKHLLTSLPSQHVVGVWIRDAGILARNGQQREQSHEPPASAHETSAQA